MWFYLSDLQLGAGNESRTRDLNLGKVALYQLSYSRIETVAPGTESHGAHGQD